MTEHIRNPNILSKLRQKLSEKITNGKTVQEQDLPQLPYLTAVIKETMRLHPPIAYTLAPEPKSWDGFTCFVPERFLDSDIDFRGRVFSFIPFSSGRRICPGMNLGLRMVSLILATLVQKFDWKLPYEMAPEDMDITDRFLDSDIDFRGRVFSFIPFSSGRRICPGMNLGLRMVSLILATLVQKFDWKLPYEMAPEDMDVTDRFGLTLRKAQPLVLIPTRL
ncbi:PREDICTED: cytochrome P450 76AD1-like [Erythranthe guttata]|uniref:cytochrome P450 76AD1-like n=1 Tax=Erythranthe guttata TaxID=4155 RepID=UPI00064DCC54|nr:PREDICTED: cytochrome P450 76AD1-like [Erythranthe guttata]|eukprot:XP_012828520.1 PREDICTED: cytochrome P450 76AD1-like [Erythranthe guttata]